jgi:DNA (cytosine-5)-methyltransferase 3A
MNVLSLFDGMSCGQQALERLGVDVSNYYASEIDKHAIAVTMANYPNTKQLGSVVGVDGYKLPKIDLLIGGSPCQSFSFAGKRKGMATKCETEILTLDHYLQLKNDGFEFEGQSYLFWEYMRILNEVKPTYFLLENVMMGEKWERILSKAIGVNPIEINSALVSAQNRRRLYWTNIGMIPGGLFGDLVSTIKQPTDKNILLKDVLEKDVAEKYFLSDKMMEWLKTRDKEPTDLNGKSGCFTAGGNSGGLHSQMDLIVHNTMPRSSTTGKGGTGPLKRQDGKTYCLDTGNTNAVEIQCVAMRGREDATALTPKRTEYGKSIRKDYEAGNIETQRKNIQQLEPRTDGKTNTLTSVQKDNLVLEKSPCLHGFEHGTNGQLNRQLGIGGMIRRLTPLECERLQTVKDNYTNHVSDTQRYRMLGNGWTVEVIVHILSYMK